MEVSFKDKGGVQATTVEENYHYIFHAGYWLGNGIMLPICTAMMADVSEVRRLQPGESKDGGYSSVFSLAMRMAICDAFSARRPSHHQKKVAGTGWGKSHY